MEHDTPGTAYLSSKYESVLRKAYFETVRDHPFEVLGEYAAKAWVTLADTGLYLLLVHPDVAGTPVAVGQETASGDGSC